MKAYTEKELTLKAETYCASAERCPSDLEEKLMRLQKLKKKYGRRLYGKEDGKSGQE